jgi:hypothetical protein
LFGISMGDADAAAATDADAVFGFDERTTELRLM